MDRKPHVFRATLDATVHQAAVPQIAPVVTKLAAIFSPFRHQMQTESGLTPPYPAGILASIQAYWISCGSSLCLVCTGTAYKGLTDRGCVK